MRLDVTRSMHGLLDHLAAFPGRCPLGLGIRREHPNRQANRRGLARSSTSTVLPRATGWIDAGRWPMVR
jgi:hypothetical protein